MNGSLARKLIISFFYSKSSIGFSHKSKLVGEGTWASLAHFLLEAEEEKPLENTYAFCLHQFGVFHLHGLWNFGHFIQVIYKMAQEKDMCSSSPARTPKLQLTAKQPSSGEWWIPPKKKIPHAQGQRRSPSKMVEGAKSRLESNPIITREAQSVQNLVHTRNPHRDWARPAFECLSISCGGTGQQWPAAGAGTLGAADLGVT